MTRRFGVEIEVCVVLNFNKDHEWLDYIKTYLMIISKHLLTNNILLKYAKTFDSIIIIKTEKYDEESVFYKYNLIDMSLEPLPDYNSIDYKHPILAPDYSVICHDYSHGFRNIHQHPSEYNNNSVNPHNYMININNGYSIKLEIISHILNSFDEFLNLKEIMLPSSIKTIQNKSQGIHLNIDVSDISTNKLKTVLINDYYPWEKENARIVRPIPSLYAKELEIYDLELMGRSINFDQLANVLTKYRSVHLKKEYDIIEFRLFSPIGNEINKQLFIVYKMFDIKKGGRLTKKMISKIRKTRKLK